MRIVKEAETRKNEILDAAEELFEIRGYDGTSTNDILEKVGISRGALYHHFKSKEDIMDSLIERIRNRILERAGKVAAQSDIPVPERLMLTMLALSIGHENQQLIEHVHKPQNALMHQKIRQFILSDIPPLLTSIIQEGIDDGIFHTPYPYESIEMVVCYVSDVIDGDLIDLSEGEQHQRILALMSMMGTLLGMNQAILSRIIDVLEKQEDRSYE